MLNIGKMAVTDEPVLYVCHGLGSCVGLFVTDTRSGLTGAAHIPLPTVSGLDGFVGAEVLLETLLASLTLGGSDASQLQAKAAGGACMLECSSHLGDQIVWSVMQKLRQKNVHVAATDVGGSFARTARYNSLTRELKISTSDCKTYSI